mmetsp:Transcript_124429/g.220456  ORF Transcript_124429/g.220456 Transcript_124429/m.220456 type:complete len:96 (-) Transcript_124429:9-296(-)
MQVLYIAQEPVALCLHIWHASASVLNAPSVSGVTASAVGWIIRERRDAELAMLTAVSRTATPRAKCEVCAICNYAALKRFAWEWLGKQWDYTSAG